METCKYCNKEFETYRQLNGHMRMHGKSEGGYSVRRTDNPETYDCIQCGKQSKWGGSKFNKYCDNVCKGEYEYMHIHLQLVLEGKKNNGSAPLRRYIFERDEHKCVKCGLGEKWNGEILRLQLDHVDGDSDNNYPDNLRVLCPNCHTQTPTWGCKGHGSRNLKYTKRSIAQRELRSCS